MSQAGANKDTEVKLEQNVRQLWLRLEVPDMERDLVELALTGSVPRNIATVSSCLVLCE